MLFQEQIVMHMATEQCWNIGRHKEGDELTLTECVGSRSQRWIIENFKPEKVSPLVRQTMDEVILRNNLKKYEKKILNETISNDL